MDENKFYCKSCVKRGMIPDDQIQASIDPQMPKSHVSPLELVAWDKARLTWPYMGKPKYQMEEIKPLRLGDRVALKDEREGFVRYLGKLRGPHRTYTGLYPIDQGIDSQAVYLYV